MRKMIRIWVLVVLALTISASAGLAQELSQSPSQSDQLKLTFSVPLDASRRAQSPVPVELVACDGCGLCTKDDDCGVGHKCCQGCCPAGQKRCYKVDVCP